MYVKVLAWYLAQSKPQDRVASVEIRIILGGSKSKINSS